LTRGEIITEALNLAGNTQITTRAQSWLNYILEELYSLYTWVFIEKNSNFSTNQASYALPTDFLYQLNMRITVGNSQSPLIYLPLPEYDSLTKSTTSEGTPQYYTIDNETKKIIFYPSPDTAYTYDFRYLYLPTALTSDSETPAFILARILVQAVYCEALKYLDDERYMQALQVLTQMNNNFKRSPRLSQFSRTFIPLDSRFFKKTVGNI